MTRADASAMDDRALLAACVEKRPAAMDVFVERFSRLVYFIVRNTTRRFGHVMDSERVADLHQEVFVALFTDDCRRLRAFEGRNECSVSSWIRLIAVRTTLNQLRRLKGHISLDAEPEGGPRREVADEAPDPFEALLESQRQVRQGRLWALAETLSTKDRLLLEMIHGQRLPAEAIAAALQISRGAVYTRKNRLINRLRRAAAAQGLLEGADAL